MPKVLLSFAMGGVAYARHCLQSATLAAEVAEVAIFE